MRSRRRAHCPRCAREVEVLDVWSGVVWAKRAWYVGLFVICCLMPIVLAEITRLLPLAMVFAAAAGPVHSLAKQAASCVECGAELSGARAGVTVQKRPNTRAPVGVRLTFT